MALMGGYKNAKANPARRRRFATPVRSGSRCIPLCNDDRSTRRRIGMIVIFERAGFVEHEAEARVFAALIKRLCTRVSGRAVFLARRTIVIRMRRVHIGGDPHSGTRAVGKGNRTAFGDRYGGRAK